jgi:uncharacterized RDD family membrane protein YckC
VTAYAPLPQDPTAVVGRRIVAFAIDFLLGMALAIGLAVPQIQDRVQTVSAAEFECGGTLDSGGPERKPIDSDLCWELDGEVNFVPADESGGVTAAVYLGFFGLGLVNNVLLQSATGASLGKLLLGLRVIRNDGRVAGIGWQFLRWVLMLVDSFCCFLPGAVLVFSTKGHRRIGDMAASTLVVPKAQVGTAPIVPGVTAPAAPGQPVPGSWGGPPATGGWAPPPDGPIWDEARDTYIQWDAPRAQWVQWDESTNQWRPIDP